MRTALSAIALGVSFACACQLASSQTVTVTQQGYGNTSSTEQVGATPPTDALVGVTATITQVGNNNHVGGPGASGSGIFQRDNRYGGAVAVVEQYGSGNNASITQDGTDGNRGAFTARITQRGALNDAMIIQNTAQMTPAIVEQNGIGNVARVEQINSGDTGVRATQNGTGNQLMIRQYDSAYYGPEVTQNGDGNRAWVVSGLWCKLRVNRRKAAYSPNGFMQPRQLPRFRTEFAPELPDLVSRTGLCECDV